MNRSRLSLAFSLVAIVLLCLPGTPLAGAQQEPEQSQEQIIHVVQPGDNLFRISLRYNSSIEAIMAANGLTDSHTIKAGQQLIIPTSQSQATAPAAPVAPAAAAPAAEIGYIVQRGDTLSSIALRHGIPLWALIKTNGLTNHIIYTDQRLIIPRTAASEGNPSDQPGANTATPSAPAQSYTVQSGDNLTQIARRFDSTVAELAQLNSIANPSAIYAGQVLRLVRPEPGPDGVGKRVLIDLSEHHLYAYEGDRLLYSFVASSGAAPSYTKTGQFYVQSKIPSAYGSTWNIWMPHWLGIYWAGSTENGIHALPILSNGGTLWAGYLGTPISYGCIVLGTWEAEQLYNWADLGTPVTIQY